MTSATSKAQASKVQAPPETLEVDSTVVACDGGGGALGHPRVYINLAKDGTGECGYCDRKFVLRKGAKPGAH